MILELAMTNQSDATSCKNHRAPNFCASAKNISKHRYCFRFTPAEWRHLLEDPEFLQHDDNSCYLPRKLMGIPVVIVPNHDAALGRAQL